MATQSRMMVGAKIMMVDDESITMEIVQTFLEEHGFSNFLLETDSSCAITSMEQYNPDLLLLDLVMPNVSGYEVLRNIRHHPRFAHLPVIILTSSSDYESRLRALDMGATDFLAKPVDPSELYLRVRNTLAAKAYTDQLAFYDPLTKLPNSTLLQKHLGWALQKARRFQENLAVLEISVDDLTRLVTSMGQHFADEVIKEVGHRIERVVRRVDLLAASNDEETTQTLFRGDTTGFTLLLERIRSADNAAGVAQRLTAAIAKRMVINENEVYVTASVGIALCNQDHATAQNVARQAASAADFARKQGGNKFMFASSEINSLYEKRASLESDLRKAIINKELALFYQPKVNARTGKVYGAEGLVRWINKDRGMVSPADFIPLAEETGLIIPIGAWVLDEACRHLTIWQRKGLKKLNISVNLSARQFDDHSIYQRLKRNIELTGMDPRGLTLELTESVFMNDLDHKIRLLEELRSLGVKISVDDFGTGYSSLSYLRRLPLDELKIDRSFIIDTPHKADTCAIVNAVVFLAHQLGLTTVAEGVEDPDQRDFLISVGCEHIQGFYFSKPLPLKDFAALLSTGRPLPLPKDACVAPAAESTKLILTT